MVGGKVYERLRKGFFYHKYPAQQPLVFKPNLERTAGRMEKAELEVRVMTPNVKTGEVDG
jgi:hypothetical protein